MFAVGARDSQLGLDTLVDEVPEHLVVAVVRSTLMENAARSRSGCWRDGGSVSFGRLAAPLFNEVDNARMRIWQNEMSTAGLQSADDQLIPTRQIYCHRVVW